MTLEEQIMKLQTYKMFEGEDTVYVERDEVLKLLEQEPCEDAISREDALMALTGEWTELTDEMIHHFIKRIKKLPPVNPQPKMGRWINFGTKGEIDGQIVKAFICSECGAISVFRMTYGKIVNGDFCPNCRAKMEVEE